MPTALDRRNCGEGLGEFDHSGFYVGRLFWELYNARVIIYDFYFLPWN